MERLKLCAHGCGLLPVSMFQKHRSGRLRPECKLCRAARRSELRKGARRVRTWALVKAAEGPT